MPGYTRPWAEVNNLLGSRDADEIDDGSRETHTDLTERFDDILYDVEADPWKVRIPGVAIDGYVSYGIPASPAVAVSGTPTRNGFDIQPSVAGAPGVIVVNIPLQIAAGSTIVVFEIKGYRTDAGASVIVRLEEVDSATEVATTLDTVSLDLVQSGIQIKQSGTLNVAAPFNKTFYFNAVITSDAGDVNSGRLSSIYVTTKLAGV